MRLEILIPLFLSIPMGLMFFVLLVYKHENLAHLKGIKDVIMFFFTPSPPERMLIVQSLDGNVYVYYDDDFEEIRTEDRVLIRTKYGDQYISKISPSESSLVVSMFDAKAPSGYPSPFGLAWRWVVAAAVLVYLVYYAFIVSIIPPVHTEEITIAGKLYKIAIQGEIDPWEILVSSVAMTLALSFFIANIVRLNDNSIKYAWYHSIGINPPHEIITPIPGMSTLGLAEYLVQLGREIKINVSKEITDLLKAIKDKVGSESLAATILAKLSMADIWRKSLADVLEEKMDLVIAGDTAARIRYGIYGVFNKKTLTIMVIVALLSFTIGYFFGNAYGFSVAPATNTTTTTTPMTPGYYPRYYSTTTPPTTTSPPTMTTPSTVPTTTSPSITPAQPPPPPG
ncbi:MAG: hypothetical protein J7L82_02375 [Staphylothermus sp.]|nr:hypothetical protein [Staphylothermus sp.]